MIPVARTVLALMLLGAAAWASSTPQPAAPPRAFAAEIERLSEAGGYFDTDNLISNESGYLRVIPELAALGMSGGAYIGVGPDQNFSYIARVRPDVAYLIDIRRDNMLLHLLFKAIFAEAATRVEYLSLLTGRAPPPETRPWLAASAARLAAHVDGAALQPRSLDSRIAAFGVRLSADDLKTIARFHKTFVDLGLDLKFQSHGRQPLAHYPTFRQLLLAVDAEGRAWSYLASEDDYRFVRALHARDGIVPVVGDVGGTHAMRAIGATLAARGLKVSAVYVSNVETYLDPARSARFQQNVAGLPGDPRGVIIRSVFSGGSSTSMLQPLAGR